MTAATRKTRARPIRSISFPNASDDRHRGPSEERHHADGRCVRRAAADRQAHAVSQAMYHFLSGFTAKVAGTEKGLGKEPQPTFSTCFGAPFMPRHPTEYGNLLRDLIGQHQADCWLVNTGWTGGAFGVGYRMPIKATRALAGRRTRRHARQCRDARRSAFPLPRAGVGAGRGCEDPEPARHLGRQGRLTTRRPRSSSPCSARTSRSSRPMSARTFFRPHRNWPKPRSKTIRHRRACPGDPLHPATQRVWVAATRAAMT